jgi:titin
MSAPAKGSSTSESQIEVTWSAPTAPSNGGSAILSYHLQWDAGTSGVTWTDVVGLSPAYSSTSIIITTGITAGASYQFKVRAQNIIDWGAFSSTTSIKAATTPSQMASVTTSIDSSTGGVKIAWVAPLDGSSTIDSYLIEISNNLGTTWTANTLYCNGASSTIVS